VKMRALPQTKHVRLERQGPVLWLWLDRPEVKNAISAQMVDEIQATFHAIGDDRSVRIVVLRGAGGIFCAGGDIKTMQDSSEPPAPGESDELKLANRRYGAMLETIDSAPQAVIAVVEGFAIGGGLGLACVADITITRTDALFTMSEVTLGLVPAAISPFVVRRIGLTAARRFGVTGARLTGVDARDVGLAHLVVGDATTLDAAVTQEIDQVLRCAPAAVAETKKLMRTAAGPTPLPTLLDTAAESFAAAVRGPEGREGAAAFLEKRKPAWFAKVE
jgi:isohexenylglutaconyl-CoA hydratase